MMKYWDTQITMPDIPKPRGFSMEGLKVGDTVWVEWYNGEYENQLGEVTEISTYQETPILLVRLAESHHAWWYTFEGIYHIEPIEEGLNISRIFTSW